MPETIMGKKVYRAGETVYAYDHLSWCVRHARVDTLSIYEVKRPYDDTPRLTINYILEPLDNVQHGSVVPKDPDRQAFRSPQIDETMLFDTLDEAVADLKRRIDNFRNDWNPNREL